MYSVLEVKDFIKPLKYEWIVPGYGRLKTCAVIIKTVMCYMLYAVLYAICHAFQSKPLCTVLLDIALSYLYTKLIYNPDTCYHPDEEEFLSGFFSRILVHVVWEILFPAPVTSSLFIKHLNLHLDF